MKIEFKHLRERLKHERLKRGLNLKEFGDLVGWDRSFVCSVEAGRMPFPLAKLRAAAKILDSHSVSRKISTLEVALLQDLGEE